MGAWLHVNENGSVIFVISTLCLSTTFYLSFLGGGWVGGGVGVGGRVEEGVGVVAKNLRYILFA